MKRFLCAALCAVMALGLAVPAWAAADFTDVTPAHWAYGDVTWAREHGVVDGVGNNQFNPEGKVANAEMIKMVVNTFFRDDYDSFEAAHFMAMRTRFGDQTYWFSYMAYYAKMTNLLDGIDVDIDSYTSCYESMTRNDMAMILYNAAVKKGLTATDAQKTAAQSAIKDYSTVPAKYQEAVKTCFALKLLNGDNGSFLGADNMTRAQACKVIHYMDTLLGGGAVTEPDPVPTNTPETPVTPSVKDIVVTQSYWEGNCPASLTQPAGRTSGTRWGIQDNGFGDGYLNNGKPITEENVIDLLHQAEKIWPSGMTWTDSRAPTGNNFYGNSGSVISAMFKRQNTGASTDFSSNFACGGFAALISDYLFGRDSNNFHRVTNMNDIRPGDIIIEMIPGTNTIPHVFIAVTSSGGSYTGLEGTTANARNGYIHSAEGGGAVGIRWPNLYTGPTNINNPINGNDWLVFSRYPN